MPFVRTDDGVSLHWIVEGDGEPILLVHGFASSLERNWRATRWIDFLGKLGRRVIAFDLRGHGRSGKPRDPSAYSVERLSGDVLEVLRAAGAERAVWMGYSMGAQILLQTFPRAPGRCRGLVLGGVGRNFYPSLGGPERSYEIVARTLEADDPAGFPPVALAYRRFAEQSGADRLALAACWRREREDPGRAGFARIDVPALVVAGSDDERAGDPRPLVEALPDATVAPLEGRDHMTAVGARGHREAVRRFLEGLDETRS